MLVVKTGMRAEYEAAKKYAAPDVLVLTGTQTVDDLRKNVPEKCEAIISFGLCGGLGPNTQVGQIFVYDRVVTPNEILSCNEKWRNRLILKDTSSYHQAGCWSSGEFNTANDQKERKQLFETYGCEVIDDETRWTAEFSKSRNIAHIGLRVVSDGAEDNLPPAVVNAIKPDGTINVLAVLISVIGDPEQVSAMLKTAEEYAVSLLKLDATAKTVGPYFGWT